VGASNSIPPVKQCCQREFLNQPLQAWASAHRGKWGQMTPLEKWMKNKKVKTCYILNFFASGCKGALTPLSKIQRTFLFTRHGRIRGKANQSQEGD